MKSIDKLEITERTFRINNIDYYLKLVPKKYFDSIEERPPFFRRLTMLLTGAYHYKQVEGIVQCEKKMWGSLPLKKSKEWKKMGKFSEIWYERMQDSRHCITIKLNKESPKRLILIQDFYDDAGGIESDRVLIEKVGRKNKSSPLEELE